jgi:cytochrome P450
MVQTAYLDHRDSRYRVNPYPILAEMREAAPVHWSPAIRGWAVLRYDLVHHVLNNPAHSADTFTSYYEALPSDFKIQSESLMRYLGNWLVFLDPPKHTRMRRLTAKVFTSRALQTIRPNVENIVSHLISEMREKDEPDLVASFSNPLPAYVIMDMLGVPRPMLPDMKVWSDEIKLFIGVAGNTENKYPRARHGVECMAAAFRELIDAHRKNPRDNILSLLIAARDDEADGGKLSDDELIATAILFLFAGHETTTNLVSMASLAMMRDEALRQQFLGLRSTCDIENAVEEFLRYDGPTPVMMRQAVEDHELGGQQISAGQNVFPVIASANRDPTMFEAPDEIRLGRTPNRHLTFGYGTHFCLGAPLARMEAQIALPELHRAFPAMTLADEPTWADGLTLRGPATLPVRLTH